MAQQSTTIKARALDKDEVRMLLELIEKYKIVTAKATNATNNRLKERAWQTISQEFSVQLGETRSPDQLRLKWENLKKAARKRFAAKKQAESKTGTKSYIPPDEILDRVASILGAACIKSSVESDGEEEHGEDEPLDHLEVKINKRGKESLSDLHKAQTEKELALAAYFRAKTENVKLENVKLKYEIEQLKKSLNSKSE